jgi:iron(III) transport system ATP-binding protein
MADSELTPDDAVETSADSPSTDEPQSVLEMFGVSKQYGAETAVSDLALDVRDGEILTLLGPSGCGKTTTLRLLAGLERPTEGTITVADDEVAGSSTFVAAEDRGVGIVFQDFALFPHLSVRENVAFGLSDRDSEEAGSRVDALLDLVDMSGMGDRSPDQLSGGQQQRVALARSLAPEPDILLLDEPFSNLDVRLRVEMREEVRRILKEAGVTAVSVTHDQEEALSISDRVAVMNDGHIEQIGDPESVFEHPESRFVASFLGQAGFLSARVGTDTVDTCIGSYDRTLLKGLSDGYTGAMVDVLVRPDDLRAVPANEATANGAIVRRQYTGPSFIYHVELDNGDMVRCLHNHAEDLDVGEPVTVDLVADHSLAWYPTQG